MPTFHELHTSFFPEDDGHEKTASAPHPTAEEELASALLGLPKQASSAPENPMKSLADIYTDMTNIEKQASARSAAPSAELEKRAEAMARAELQKEAAIMKTAQEYDAAGRIMARGFVDEFGTQMALLEKLGMEGYVAGQIENDLDPSRTAIPTTGSAPEQHNKDLDSSEGVKAKLGPNSAPAIITVKSMQQAAQPSAQATSTDLGG